MNNLITRSAMQAKFLFRYRAISPLITCKPNEYYIHSHSSKISYCKPSMFLSGISLYSFDKKILSLPLCRHFSKKKKSSRFKEEVEESDDEEQEIEESDEIIDDYNLIIKSVASLRMDSVLKAGLGTSKKKVEKDFYATKIRINGEKVLKKAAAIQVDDELDLVKSFHPDNGKMLLVDRIIVKTVGRVNENGNFPIKMQVFKSLAIENYNDPYVKSSLSEED